MSFKLQAGLRVFLFSEAIDMRAGLCKLQALVTEKMKESLYEGCLFIFFGNNRRRIKMLLFDGTGLVLIVKRLDRGQFMPIMDFFETREIALSDLERILDGANLRVVFAAAKRKRESKEVA